MLLALMYGICLSYPNPTTLLAASLIVVAAFITDLLDGYLARTRNIISNFGICFDPIADKIFTLCALAMLITYGSLALPMMAYLFIVIREVGISGVRVILLSSDRLLLPAERLGKLKSGLQFGLILFFTVGLWIQRQWGADIPVVSFLLKPPRPATAFWVVAIYTFASSWVHLWRHRKALGQAWLAKEKL